MLLTPDSRRLRCLCAASLPKTQHATCACSRRDAGRTGTQGGARSDRSRMTVKLPHTPRRREAGMTKQVPEPFTLWHGLLLAESAALMIGLLMPVTPNKLGSGRGLAELVLPASGYFEQAAFYFVMVNGLIVVLGLIAAAWWLISGRGDAA